MPVRNDAIPQSKCLIEDVRGFKINVLRCCLPRVHTHQQQCYPVNGSVDIFFLSTFKNVRLANQERFTQKYEAKFIIEIEKNEYNHIEVFHLTHQ